MSARTLIRSAELVASPWKNGGGVTSEIAIGIADATRSGANDGSQPARLDTFAWRVSLADVAQPGPFSRFVGIDRVLVLLSGAGMLLDERSGDGDTQHTHALAKPLDVARFAGETVIDARLVDGPTRDFNLMTRRGVASGEVDVWRGAGTHTLMAHVVLLFCASGETTVSVSGEAPVRLLQDDTLRFDADPPHALTIDVQGDGALLAIRINLHDRDAGTNDTNRTP
ncbi:HutD family protein [Paraburkholderia phosphatilytica]|uniref:HutD/Ves family protein n=1 Tax=Paraburkholderia phosphatilytica TaxID=2282883 RepID=UPI000E4F88C6|nr:HutD family protein [Paraburkholderia phosphatilytica]